MVDKEEVHPLVTLLLERMKSHPEEFECYSYENTIADEYSPADRWRYAVEEIKHYGSDADNDALDIGLRSIRLDAAHKWALDELLNGDERRAEAKRKEAERAQRYAYQNARAAQQLQGIVNLGGGGGGGANIAHPLTSGMVSTGNYTSVTAPHKLQLGNEVIDESFLSTVKKKLGI